MSIANQNTMSSEKTQKNMQKPKNIIKRFLAWIGLKEKIHNNESLPPLFKENEIWWSYIGENVGVEINGKDQKFTRPVFVFKKYDKYSFLGLPLTTKPKTGSWFAPITFIGINQNVVLSQGRVYDYRRFKEKIGELDEKDSKIIRDMYFKLHNIAEKNRPPVISDRSRG